MADTAARAWPADLCHLLAEQLLANADYDTLYSCVVSSRYFASSGAVAALYRCLLAMIKPTVKKADILQGKP
jgi:hypothetical protein